MLDASHVAQTIYKYGTPCWKTSKNVKVLSAEHWPKLVAVPGRGMLLMQQMSYLLRVISFSVRTHRAILGLICRLAQGLD